MNLKEEILAMLKEKEWTFIREIKAKLPDVKRSTLYSAVYTLKEDGNISARGLRGKYGGLISGSVQYAITDEGKQYLSREKTTVEV